jgi:SAM-dependent methyltransferase
MPLTQHAERLAYVEARHRYTEPLMLAPFAADLARRLSRLSNGPLLELAADTGVLTLALAGTISAGVTIVAAEADPVLIEAARARGGLTRVTWERAQPATLPFPDGQFAIITCLFGLATMPDRLRVMREARRVMKQGGHFIFNVPGPLRLNPVAAAVHACLAERFPADPPGCLSLGLHGYADGAVDDDLTAAGFASAIYAYTDVPVATSARGAALGYCLGSGLRTEIAARGEKPEDVSEAVAADLRVRFGPDPITTGMRALVVSASL